MKLFVIFILFLEMIFIDFSSSSTLTTEYVTDEMTTEGNPCTAQGKFYLDLKDFCTRFLMKIFKTVFVIFLSFRFKLWI